MMNVFIVSFELGASTQKSELKFAGGFVSVAVVAPEIRKALDWTQNALLEDGYQVRMIESVQLFQHDELWRQEQLLMVCSTHMISRNLIDLLLSCSAEECT